VVIIGWIYIYTAKQEEVFFTQYLTEIAGIYTFQKIITFYLACINHFILYVPVEIDSYSLKV